MSLCSPFVLCLDPYPLMQAIVDSIMSDTVVACNNCRDLHNQLYEMRQRIAQFTRSESCQNAYYYHEQIVQQNQKYKINLEEIAADKVLRQKIHDDQSVRLNDEIKKQIMEQSLVHEFKCHRYTEKTLRDTQEALAYERERNTKLLAIASSSSPVDGSRARQDDEGAFATIYRCSSAHA